MADPIQTICSLTGCSQHEAERVLAETEDVIEAVDRLLAKNPSPADKYVYGKKRPREVSPEEMVIGKYRSTLKHFDELVSTSMCQPARGELDATQVHHEEKAPQSNCSQQYPPASRKSEVEIPEIAYPLPSECSCDSQLRDQTQPCSGPQCPQSCQVQETVSLQTGGQTPA